MLSKSASADPSDSDGADDRPGRRRSPWVIAAAAGIGLFVGLGAVTAVGAVTGSGVFNTGPTPQQQAAVVLRADALVLLRVAGQVDQAEDLQALNAAGDNAQSVLRGVQLRTALVDKINDQKVRLLTQRVHAATVAAITGDAQLADVTEKHLDAWDDAQSAVSNASGTLDASNVQVVALDTKHPIRVNVTLLDHSTAHASRYLTKSAKRLANYERKLAAFRRKHRRQIQAAADYEASVSSQMSAYEQTRTDLQKYLTDAKEFYTHIDDFRSELQAAGTRRQGILSTLSSITPPAPVAAAHQGLIDVLNKAVSGTEIGVRLADATQKLRDQGDGTSGFDLPEYKQFQDASDEITNTLGANMAAWQSAVAAYEKSLKSGKGAPEKPSI